jgi:hypothetical protein
MFIGNCKIVWNVEDVTNKHILQSSWKRVVIANIEGELCDYYRWFILKRFGVSLNPPLRGPHITIVNDKIEDFESFDKRVNELKTRYSFINIEDLDLSVRYGPEHIWFRCLAPDVMNLREELGLGKPHMGFHVTIGSYRKNQLDLANWIKQYGENY